ncbi:MAG: pyridoxamine 5'-phosphate oxidase family protein [Firmicutes bacterium]|nr:pyridoxamine 5'-phosphate oxidase family protein [Bacillota bacterium]
MRRKDREKDEAFALGTLRGCEYASLATVNPDGTPYCVPISPVAEGDAIYFHCAPEGKKLENIALNPNVCVCCARRVRLVPELFTAEYESAVAEGRCEPVLDEGEKKAALRLICEKYAASNPNAEAEIDGALARTAVYKVTIARVTGKANRPAG